MDNRRLNSINFQNDSNIFNSPVSNNFQSIHSKMSETLNFSRMSTTFNQFSTIHEQSTDRTLTPHRQNDNLSNLNLSSFSKTLELLNESEEDDAKEQEISRLIIFEAFFQISKGLNDSTDALHLLKEFDQTCDDNLIVTSEMLSDRLRTDAEIKYLERFAKLVHSERDTWKLFRMLYTDRIEVQGAEKDAEDEMDIDEDLRLRLSDFDLANLNLQRNSSLREIHIIVNWLEEINDEKFDYGNEFVIESQIYWETTFKLFSGNSSSVQNNSLFSKQLSSSNLGSMSDLCNQFDPDAPMRTGNKIADDDKDDENRLFQCMFRLIRRGKVDEAQDTAERAGFWWLSSALDGWKLYHNPNYVEKCEDESGNDVDPNQNSEYSSAIKELSPQTGNPLRDLWKQHAWNFSKVSGSNLYERALFATFSGNREILLQLCNNWKDRMWAYFRCSLEANIERIFRESAIDKPDLLPRTCDELPEEFWDNCLSAEEIFNELSEKDVGNEDDYHREIAKLLILGRIDELVCLLFKWTDKIKVERLERKDHRMNRTLNMSLKQSENAEEKSKVIEPNLLRFFAHVVIALLQLKLITEPDMNESCLSVIESYTEYLVEYKLIQLVAHYSQFLPHDRQLKTFSSLLETIDNEDDRQVCMEVAKQAQMNLPVLLSTVVERIQTNASGNNNNKSIHNIDIDEHDYLKTTMTTTITNNSTTTSTILNSTTLLTPQVTGEDLKRINALNWLLLDKDNPQYVELLRQVNALIRAFLLDRKVDLAKETIDKMPNDLIEKAFFQWKAIQQAQVDASSNLSEDGSIETASTTAEVDIENVIREYLCHRVFFEAKEAFDNWHRCLYQDRPHPPAEPKQLLKLSERVAHEQAMKEYEQNRRYWQTELSQEADNTREKINIFLQFPDGIWCDVDGLNTFEKFINQKQTNNTGNGVHKSENHYLDSILRNSNIDKVSTNDRNTFYENILKKLDNCQDGENHMNLTSRLQQFNILRTIYIKQYLTLLNTINVECEQAR